MVDEYFTIAKPTVIKRKIERSEFIAHAREVSNEEEVRAFLSEIQEEHRNATHNCYAYRLGIGAEEISYSSDAGEPSGTAGRPILGSISSKGLTNVMVIVTRYFGGKKLGVPGLIKAYGETSEEALEAAGRCLKIITENISLRCDYSKLNQVLYLVDKYKAKVIDSTYTDEVSLTVSVRRRDKSILRDELSRHVKEIKE